MDVAQSSIDNYVKDFFEQGSFKKFEQDVTENILNRNTSLWLITGPDGSGKTTLKESIKNNLGTRIKFCEIKVDPEDSVKQISDKITTGFNLGQNQEQLFDKWTILIDDAQFLSTNQIKAILQLNLLQEQMPKPVSIVLLGNAVLSQRISTILNEKSLVINFTHFRMPILDQTQLYQWCEKILSNLNLNNKEFLSDENLEKIWDYCKGSPFMLEKAIFAIMQQGELNSNLSEHEAANKDKANMNLLSIFVGGFLLVFAYQIFTSNMYLPFGLLSFIT